jgi:hypothetical protein
MGLADRFSSYEKPRVGARCTTCHLEVTLPKDDADALMKALADPSVSNAAISEILKSEGHPIGETSIRRHRKGMCKGHGSE